ncbi:hypothetical protein HMPREF9582_00052 [Cutibacterium acnes HL060PA1]|uniref:Prephenate dehydratase n=1 Tax=Cutibacterium acnes TaxID=1747 RepID=A0AA44U363_CUTAC|nr:hypothetical protein HMPREF9603_02572 [Cutibacterium acnes HL001PA1]EFT10039.1 hypothetical protein HMPREF9619_01502 [Cutibacterium acnes HL082PA2]EFT24833.1 hypothetical protein HMPREF9577_02609 [Cutibacterium acnes HL110PA3]EFT62918.1 hypothetical protein HMPREF9578_01339 [Cutibacterium acnes HL110PA4]EFT67143.1 hypothetical protein HMPREF9582_00052 [Cutibacterium acnes HL060PA1]EFT77260.1 hypothetical protein HMPREF9599_01416 [Cutibacterium acnes HL050PA2]EGE70555.1 hypothetical protein
MLEILQHFTFRKINVSRIESRLAEDRLGQCCFSTDTIGYVEDERMVDALKRDVSNRSM